MGVKEILKGLADGFYYIGKGFSMMTMFPYMDYQPISDREAFMGDANALRRDFRIVTNDLEKAIEKTKKELGNK